MNYRYLKHEFDPRVAEVYGINAAILFGYIAHRSRNTPGRWVSLTLGDICKRYPYFGRKECWLALQRLIHPGGKTAPLVMRKGKLQGVGFLYAPSCHDTKCDAPHSFNVKVAMDHGVVSAIIYSNVSFWIRENWIKRSDEALKRLVPEDFDLDGMKMQEASFKITRKAAAHFGSVKAWAEAHPCVSLRDTERSFASLVKSGLLKRSHTSDRIAIWTLPPRKQTTYLAKWLKSMDFKNAAAKRANDPPEGNTHRQKETLTAKRKQELPVNLPVSPSGSEGSPVPCETPYEACSEAVVARSARQKPVSENYDVFHTASSLADARSESGGTPSADACAYLNKPNLPRKKKKEKPDAFSWGAKGQYVKHRIDPEEDDYFDALEALSPEEREDYFKRLSKLKLAGETRR